MYLDCNLITLLFNSKAATEPPTTLAEAEVKANSVDQTATTPAPPPATAPDAVDPGKKCAEGDADCRSYGYPMVDKKKGLDLSQISFFLSEFCELMNFL